MFVLILFFICADVEEVLIEPSLLSQSQFHLFVAVGTILYPKTIVSLLKYVLFPLPANCFYCDFYCLFGCLVEQRKMCFTPSQ